MERCTSENNNTTATKKRARDVDESNEFDPNSPEFKRVNAGTGSGPDPPESERVDPESDPNSAPFDSPVSEVCHLYSEDNSNESNGAEDGDELVSPEVVKFREDILDILDEPETVPESQDLDSVIRSFEEEILQLSPSLVNRPAAELLSDPSHPQPDLGYLLEASDDELGLPPTVTDPFPALAPGDQDQSQNEPINLSANNQDVINGLGNMVEFEDELTRYDSYEFGLGDGAAEGGNYEGNGNGDFVTVDGLFDYADTSDFPDMAWRPESLPAL